MSDHCLYAPEGKGLSDMQIRSLLDAKVQGEKPRRVLLIPPDISRFNSYAGPITCMLFTMLSKQGAYVDVLPALGSHQPMTPEETAIMYPDIPAERILVHHWRQDVCRLGEIPQEVIERLSKGAYRHAVPVELNRRLLEGGYDRIYSIGQVVPHEVAGIANYLKNLFVGCGGSAMINASHYIGALHGMEKIMGRDHSPVHELFDYAREAFISTLPVTFIMTVNTLSDGELRVRGFFVGEDRSVFEKAVALSQQENITFVAKPLQKVIAFLDGFEFKKTWVGNKAIYRTRMAIADGGELIIIAPGISGFGEDPQIDTILRQYGYCGSAAVSRAVSNGELLSKNLSVAAHIIHSSPDGRFRVTYAPGKLTKEETEQAGFDYMPIEEAMTKYSVNSLKAGFNQVNGEEIYFIPNPAIGLWACRERFV